MKLRHLFLSGTLIMIVFAFLTLLPLFTGSLRGKDIIVLITFVLNAILIIFRLICTQKKHPFSIEMMVWVFLFFFMYFSPILQYLSDRFPWDGDLNDSECVYANLIIFLFISCFSLGKVVSRKIVHVKKNNNSFLTSEFSFSKGSKIFVTIVSVLLAAYSIQKTGLLGIIVSRDDATAVFYSGKNSALRLIVESIVPGFLAYSTAEAAQDFSNGKKGKIRFFVQLLCLVVCFFPTAIPRYKMACIYLTILIVMMPCLKVNNRFFWLFVSALFFIFPVLSSFRHGIDWTLFSDFFTNFKSSYTGGDYDAYRMLVSAIRFVDNNGIVWGNQLLGVLLFFVPSRIWTGKPGGSGAFLIQTEFGSDVFSNVSCPYIAEGFLNFGIVGVIIFALMLGALSQRFDDNYWSNINSNSKFAAYIFLMLMIFFIMRGDLLSSFAFTVGFLFTGWMLRIMCKRSNSISRKYD